KKDWPAGFRERLKQEVDPCMLVVDVDFDAFDPRCDRWAVIWFSDLALYARDLAHLFHRLALLSRVNRDLFQYLRDLVLKGRHKRAAGWGRFTRYFELGKPELFGVSIDVKAILTHVLDAVAGPPPPPA